MVHPPTFKTSMPLSSIRTCITCVQMCACVLWFSHQWYWSYEVQNLGGEILEFDSYM